MHQLIDIKKIGYVLLCFSSVSLANNVTVYRWVDKNNIVHYSQHQPAHDNYTELTMSNVAKKKNESPSANAQEEKNEDIAIASSSNKCEEAKANVRMLKAYDKIQYTDAQGTVQVLTEQEKTQQLQINETKEEVYCNQ